MLSPKVKESLEEAQGNLRNALAYAARTEKPAVNKQISEIMAAIECLMKVEEMSDRIEAMMDKMNKEGGNGHFFGGMF